MVGTVLVLGARGQVLRDEVGQRVAEREAERLVGAADGLDRVAQEVEVVEVGDLRGGELSALVGSAVEDEPHPHGEPGGRGRHVDRVAAQPPPGDDRARRRRDGPDRIAVGEDHAGVRIHREQRGEAAGVRGGLEHP